MSLDDSGPYSEWLPFQGISSFKGIPLNLARIDYNCVRLMQWEQNQPMERLVLGQRQSQATLLTSLLIAHASRIS